MTHPDDLAALFPEAAVDPNDPRPPPVFPKGEPIILRNLIVADAGAPLQLGSSGGAAARAGGAGQERLMYLVTAPGTRMLRRRRAGGVGVDQDALRCDGYDRLCAMWMSPQGRAKWASLCAVEALPQAAQAPSPLCELYGTRLPALTALTADGARTKRTQASVSEVVAALPLLHANEVRELLVMAKIEPPPAAGGTGAWRKVL